MPRATAIERIEEFTESTPGKVLGFGFNVGSGALVGAYLFPLFKPSLSRRDAAIEGAVLSGGFALFDMWRKRRGA